MSGCGSQELLSGVVGCQELFSSCSSSLVRRGRRWAKGGVVRDWAPRELFQEEKEWGEGGGFGARTRRQSPE